MVLDTEKTRKRLEQKREELRGNIANLTEAHPQVVTPEEASEGPQDFEETAVDFLETHQEQAVEVNENALLTEVEDALKRIDEGKYGVCVDCGKPIPEPRLEAIPWAARCVEDEAKLEQYNLGREELYHQDSW
jgi:DnaK suppressor protein